MLATSGQLNLTPPTGSPVENLPVGEIGRNANAVSTATRGNTNRSVYLPIVRSFLPKMFETFDFADPSMVKGRRDVTTVATQALFLLNSGFVAEQSRLTAKRVLQTQNTDNTGKVQFAYRLVLSRTPSDEETARALEYIGSTARSDKDRLDAWSGSCQALFACAEFRYLN